ncbi:11461_t:CDS:2 [Scutellospora calospora]|uniref:11461_t:CDS:1 n=1 Tax=Scutellospora calospora TaxID=85575 RepID=A0ACA9KNB6_9GLOM|nr:11461_t:CDS:2 [Scutellospora calospora]
MIQKSKNNDFLEQYNIELIPYNSFEKFKADNAILSNAIIHGKREVTVLGTPKKYIKIYTECWQNDLNQRPIIQNVFKDLNKINYDKEEIFTEYDKNEENKDQLISESSNTTDLLIHYTSLHNETAKELNLISSIIATLKKSLVEDKLLNNQHNILNLSGTLNTCTSITTTTIPFFPQTNITKQFDSSDQQFLDNLNQIFITQFNVQSASKDTSDSIIYHLRKYIDINNKNTVKILKQYDNHQYRYTFTSIMGFFYEYGIGTTVDYNKAFNMYRQAANNCRFTKNHLIGLISLADLQDSIESKIITNLVLVHKIFALLKIFTATPAAANTLITFVLK